MFPTFLPVDKPPQLRGTIQNGQPTPRYALGWVRDLSQVYKEHPGKDMFEIGDRVMLPQWTSNYKNDYPLCIDFCSFIGRFSQFVYSFQFSPRPVIGPSVEDKHHAYLLFASNTDRATIECTTRPEIIERARECMRVPDEDQAYTI